MGGPRVGAQGGCCPPLGRPGLRRTMLRMIYKVRARPAAVTPVIQSRDERCGDVPRRIRAVRPVR